MMKSNAKEPMNQKPKDQSIRTYQIPFIQYKDKDMT